jgi:hypothetical protein
MTSLQETLPALATLLAELPGWTEELAQRATAQEAAANELLKQIATVRQQTTELDEVIEEERRRLRILDDIRRGVEPQELGCESVEEMVDALLELTRDSTAPVVDVGDAVQDGMSGDESHFADRADDTRANHEETETQLGTMEEMLRAGQDLLQSALDAAAQEMQALRDAVSNARSDVSQAADALRGRLSTLLADGRAEVERTGETLRSLLDAQEDHLGELSARIEAGRETLTDTVRQRVESEVRERTVAAVQQLAEVVVTLGETAAAAQEAAGAARTDLEARFDALGQALAPMPAAIEQVKQAAREVGLPWE